MSDSENSSGQVPRVRAPELDRPGLSWINTPEPLSLKKLRGRLTILDFWTFCCINCIHIIPTLRRIEAAFPEEVVVIGVHSPKFSAEKSETKLRQAISRYGIEHPVIQDSDHQLWRDYAVRAWPTLVFIDPDSRVIGHLSGEPDAERLLTAVSEMIETWDRSGALAPKTLELESGIEQPRGRFRFPAKVKPLPGDTPRWVLVDSGNHQVVILDDGGAELQRFGNGEPGRRDGAGETASFRDPQGLIANREAIYVADTGNHAVRRIDLESNLVETLCGTGERGRILDPQEEPALTAALASPWDLELLDERLFIANAGTHQLAELDLAARSLRALAGNGAENLVDGPAADAQLAQPSGLALDAKNGALYFVDSETSSLRVLYLDEDRVETLVGQGLFDFGKENGPFPAARLQHPLGVAVAAGEVLVADSYNDALRRLDLAAQTASDLDQGFLCTDALCLPLSEPAGVWARPDDTVLAVDTNNHRIMVYDSARGESRTWAS